MAISIEYVKQPPPTIKMSSKGESQLVGAVSQLLDSLYGKKMRNQVIETVFEIEEDSNRFNFLKTLASDLVEATRGVNDLKGLIGMASHKFNPVSIEEFLNDDYYLGLKDELYPLVMEELIEANSGKYVEAVYTGSIGSAKTSQALWTTAYQLYLLSALRNPQRTFGLVTTDEILFIFQSLNAQKAKSLNYARFRALIEKSLYFKEEYPFDPDLLSELQFPHRVIVRPIAGSATASIGENVIGGVIDEVNFMSITEKSKQADDGGTYDQALVLYNSISKRRKSRFMKFGHVAGILCLVSSKRFPGQFTDQKEEEAEEDPTIYVYDKRLWDIRPEIFSGEMFQVFTGDESHKPRILEDDEEVPEELEHLVMDVPVENRKEFETDIMNALRDVAGVSTLAIFPFMDNVELVAESFKEDQPSILSTTTVDFYKTQLSIYPKRFYKKSLPRWVHIDLGITGDSAGVTMGTVDKFVDIDRGHGIMETLPHVHIDFQLEVKPPPGGEIIFSKIRTLLYRLSEFGMNIKWVSFDSFQSRDSMQVLRQMGYTSGQVSMDTSTLPYDITKAAIYDGRVSQPVNEHLKTELVGLERDAKTNKVDHRPNGSKDVADSLAGVVYGLTLRKEIWFLHKAPIRKLPESLQALLDKDNMKEATDSDKEESQHLGVE